MISLILPYFGVRRQGGTAAAPLVFFFEIGFEIRLPAGARILRCDPKRRRRCALPPHSKLFAFISDEPTARQSCTVQPRSGSPQPDCTYCPSLTMHGTVGSPPENLNISARYSLFVCASRSRKVMPFEL